MFRRRWPIAAAAGPDALAAAYRSYCEASCFCFDHAWSRRWAASAVGRRLELRDRTECMRSSFDFARFRADSSGGSGSSCWGKAGVRGLCTQRVCRGRVPAEGLGAKSPRSCGINAHTHTHTHTHTHPFNGPISGTTRVSQYQKGNTNLDFTEARDSERQWHQLGHMQVCTSFQTDNHASTSPLSFLQAGCPFCRPTNSVKALKAISIYFGINAFSVMSKTFSRIRK